MLQWAGDACVISWEHLHWEGRERKSTVWSCSRIQNQHLSSLRSSSSWAPMSPKPNTSAATKQILKKNRTKQKPTANQQQNNSDIKSESWLKVNLKLNLTSGYMFIWLFLIGIEEQNMYGMAFFCFTRGKWFFVLFCDVCVCTGYLGVGWVKQTDSLQALHLNAVPCLPAYTSLRIHV